MKSILEMIMSCIENHSNYYIHKLLIETYLNMELHLLICLHFMLFVVFEVESITSKDVQSCILNDTPVIGIIDSGNNMAHELFIIGYFADTDMYQTLNPATGTFQAFNKNDFCSFQPSIVLSQMRSCSQSGKSFFCRRHTHGHILSFICTFASWTYPICIYGVIVICDKFCSTL